MVDVTKSRSLPTFSHCEVITECWPRGGSIYVENLIFYLTKGYMPHT